MILSTSQDFFVSQTPCSFDVSSEPLCDDTRSVGLQLPSWGLFSSPLWSDQARDKSLNEQISLTMPADAMTMNDSDLNRSASSPSSSPPSPLPTPTSSSIPSVNKSSQEEVETPDGSSPTASSSSLVNDVLSYLVWPCIILLPLVLTFNDMYKHVFPSEWYVTRLTHNET